MVETLELGAKLAGGGRPRAGGDHRQRRLARALQRGGRQEAARRVAQRPRPGGAAAVRAALAEHDRARMQRGHLTRLTKESGTKVVTLPYLFASELGLPEYQLLADDLAESL